MMMLAQSGLILNNPLGLLGLIMVPILILIYLLKRRSKEKTVSSTFLWKLTLKKMKRKIPFNLKGSLLLLLQILTVVIISFILSDPYVMAWETGETVIIVDGSASMMTEVDGTTRLDRVKAALKEISYKADQNHRVSVIFAGDTAETVIKRSDQQVDIAACLDDYACTWGDADLMGALKEAQSILQENAEAKIILYTDKTYQKQEGVEVRDVTQEEWNLSCVALNDVSPKQGVCIFQGTIVSYGRDADVAVALYVDGQFTEVCRVSCKAGENTTVNFKTSSITTYEVAEMRVDNSATAETDHFTTDNSYYFYPQIERPIRVQLYQQTTVVDRFLGYALNSNNRVVVTTVTKESDVAYEGFDVYIFDGTSPVQIPKDGAVWLFNATDLPLESPFLYGNEVMSQAGNPYPLTEGINSGTESYKQLTAGIRIQDLVVTKYTPIVPAVADYETIFTCNGDAVLVSTFHGKIPYVMCTISQSNLKPSINFPLLIQNLLSYSVPDLYGESSFLLGETTEIQPPVNATGITVKLDGVRIDMLDAENTTYRFDKPGRYEFTYTDEEGNDILSYPCFVYLSETETNIFGTDEAVSALPLLEGSVPSYEPIAIWQYLLLALALVYLAEWGVYHHE